MGLAEGLDQPGHEDSVALVHELLTPVIVAVHPGPKTSPAVSSPLRCRSALAARPNPLPPVSFLTLGTSSPATGAHNHMRRALSFTSKGSARPGRPASTERTIGGWRSVLRRNSATMQRGL